jgi:hypothetical protein
MAVSPAEEQTGDEDQDGSNRAFENGSSPPAHFGRPDSLGRGPNRGVLRTKKQIVLGFVFSGLVLVGVVLATSFGGSSHRMSSEIILIGTGHRVKFSPSEVTVEDLDGNCSDTKGWVYWVNETGSTQDAYSDDGALSITLPRSEPGLVGTCENPPGTYIYDLKGSPAARLVVTVLSN